MNSKHIHVVTSYLSPSLSLSHHITRFSFIRPCCSYHVGGFPSAWQIPLPSGNFYFLVLPHFTLKCFIIFSKKQKQKRKRKTYSKLYWLLVPGFFIWKTEINIAPLCMFCKVVMMCWWCKDALAQLWHKERAW